MSRAERAGRLVDAAGARVLPSAHAGRRREPWEAPVVRCRFAGIELLAGRGVFLPRGVSERLFEAALAALAQRGPGATVVDVGTGCGAVALALGVRRPGIVVIGTELDELAATWARRNATRLGVPFAVHVGSLLESLAIDVVGTVDVICGNVPCVPAAEFASAADAPATAYVGSGGDGLGLQRELARTARHLLAPGGVLALQLAPTQWDALASELTSLGYAVEPALGDDAAVVGTAVWQPAQKAQV
jgi:release factor glutamine methyltransferase